MERSDGRIERMRGKSIYLNRDRDWCERFTWIGGKGFQDGLTLGAVDRRLAALFGPADLDQDGEPTEECEANASLCWDALATIECPVETAFDRELRERALIKAGYFLAKAEAAVLVLPHAERGLRAQQNQISASRAASARADPVRAAAQADMVANPGTTQNACASRIAAQMSRDQRSVSRTIAPMFEWRDLPGGRRETRPKPEFLAAPARP